MHIDVHAHYWTDDYLDLLDRYGRTTTANQRGMGAGHSPAELDARFASMDAAGIDLQVLSASPQQPTFDNLDHAVTAARYINDAYAELVTAHPHRFRAFAALPLPHLDAALAETTRALDELGMLGVAVLTSTLGRPLTDDAFTPLFDELNHRAAVLYIHPAGTSACSPLIANSHLTWMIGAPIEGTICAVQLITHGIPSRYPNIRIINSHLGGMLPMALQRLDNQYRWEAPHTPETPSIAARRMYYDTVGHGHLPALRCAIDSLGADRLLLGTDFPYQAGPLFQTAVDYITQSGLPDTATEAILGDTATTILRLH
jgi:6-methylsalicylate decarboxylase